jgi:hypothetical protein
MSRGFDEKKALNMILDYYRQYIPELADGFAKVLEREFANDQVALKGEWISKAIRDIMKTEIKYDGKELYIEVGWDYDSLWEEVRVLVGLYGSGSQNPDNGGLPLWTKPGQPVWDGRFEGEKQESQAKELYPLPDAFNRPGNDALEKAQKAFKPIYDQQVAIINQNIPIGQIIEACMM